MLRFSKERVVRDRVVKPRTRVERSLIYSVVTFRIHQYQMLVEVHFSAILEFVRSRSDFQTTQDQ